MTLEHLGMTEGQLCHYALRKESHESGYSFAREPSLFGRRQRVVYTIEEVTAMIKK